MNTKNKGTIHLGNKVMVSDPCYGLNTWCQGIIENVLPGNYDCNIEYKDKGDWGIRVSAIQATHVDYDACTLDEERELFEVGVDSGQAGIFDYDYYADYHSDQSEWPHVNEDWYDRCGELTYYREKNPNYEPFNWDKYRGCDFDVWHKALTEYDNSDKSCISFERLDGNTIDGLGIVSSSGWGDGGYSCFTRRNEDGKVVSIRVEFIGEYEEDEIDDE